MWCTVHSALLCAWCAVMDVDVVFIVLCKLCAVSCVVLVVCFWMHCAVVRVALGAAVV